MNSFINLIFHFLTFSIFVYTVYFDIYHTHAPPDSQDSVIRTSLGGRLKYLTFINGSILQIGFFGFCVINDIFGSNVKQPARKSSLQKFRDFAFTTVVFPIAVFVCFTFWGLYAIDRELIFSKSLDAWIPNWMNQCYHTLPLFTVILELIMTNHQFQKGSMKYLPVLICTTGYIIWISYVAYKINFWVYTVLEVLSPLYRIAFLTALSLPPLLFIYLEEKLHNMIWRKSNSPQKTSGKGAKTKNKKNK